MSEPLEPKNADSKMEQNAGGFLPEIFVRPIQILTILGTIADMISIILWLSSGGYWADKADVVAITISIILVLFIVLLYIEHRKKQNQIPISIISKDLEQLPQKKTELLEPTVEKPIENQKVEVKAEQTKPPLLDVWFSKDAMSFAEELKINGEGFKVFSIRIEKLTTAIAVKLSLRLTLCNDTFGLNQGVPPIPPFPEYTGDAPEWMRIGIPKSATGKIDKPIVMQSLDNKERIVFCASYSSAPVETYPNKTSMWCVLTLIDEDNQTPVSRPIGFWLYLDKNHDLIIRFDRAHRFD